jgi:hypothetical protein
VTDALRDEHRVIGSLLGAVEISAKRGGTLG